MSLIKIEEQDYEGNVYHKTTSADIVIAKDTGGLAGTVGENSNVQTLLDKLTDRVVNKLIEKGLIVDNFATQIKGFIPDATLVTQLKEAQDEQNNNIGNIVFGKSEGARVSDANNADIGVTTITQNDQNTPFNFWGTLITTGRNGYRQQLAFPWSRAEKNLKYRCEDGGTWEDWVTFVANSDLPVFESLVIDPLGKDQVQLDLKFNTNSYSVIAFNADFVAFDGFVIGSNIINGTNKLNIRLSKAHSGQIRINIAYMRA